MDFNDGFTLNQKKDFRVQITWPPARPDKTLQSRTLILDDCQIKTLSGYNMLDTAPHALPGAPTDRFSQERIFGRLESCSYTNGLQHFQVTESPALLSYRQIHHQVGSGNAGPSMPALSNSIGSWAHQTPYLNLVAYTDAAAVSQGPYLTPPMFSRMGSGVREQVLQNQLLPNEQVLLEASQFTTSNNGSKMKTLWEPSLCNGNNGTMVSTQNGVAYPFSPNPNTLTEKIVDPSGSNVVPYPFTPLSRKKNKSVQNQIPSEVIDLEDTSPLREPSLCNGNSGVMAMAQNGVAFPFSPTPNILTEKIVDPSGSNVVPHQFTPLGKEKNDSVQNQIPSEVVNLKDLKPLLEPSLCNGNSGTMAVAKNGVAFPFSPNPNILAKKIVDPSGSNVVPYTFNPLSREKNKSVQIQIPSEVIDLEDMKSLLEPSLFNGNSGTMVAAQNGVAFPFSPNPNTMADRIVYPHGSNAVPYTFSPNPNTMADRIVDPRGSNVVPYPISPNPNTMAERIVYPRGSNVVPYPFAPLSREKNQSVKNQIPSEVIDLEYMKSLLETSLCNGKSGTMEVAQNAVAFPFSSPNPNILAEKIVDPSGSNVVPYPFTPLSREKNKSMQNQIPSEVIYIEDDSETEGNLLNVTVNLPEVEAKEVDLCSWESALPASDPIIPSSSESVLPSDTANLNQLKIDGKTVHSSESNTIQQIDVERHDNVENKDMDMNKTPRQKDKRKKHRPKVIREDKPRGAKELATPKPVTPKAPKDQGKNLSGKRKHVGKKKIGNPTEKASMTPVETEDSSNIAASTSARRCLNFDHEVPQARTEPAGSSIIFGHNETCQELGKPPQGKRKYVRRKKVDGPTEKVSRALEDTVDPDHIIGSESVLRCLSFGSEATQVRNEHPGGFPVNFSCNKHGKGQDACLVDGTSSSASMSNSHLAQVPEVGVDKPTTRKKIDLKSSMNQNLEYIRDADQMLPEKYKPPVREKVSMDQMLDKWKIMPKGLMLPSSQPLIGKVVKEKSIDLCGKSDHISNTTTNYDQYQESGTSLIKPNEMPLKRKTKKRHGLNNDAHKCIIQVQSEPYLSWGHKKRRTMHKQDRFTYSTTSSSAYMLSNDSGNDQLLLDNAEHFTSHIAQLLKTPDKQQTSICNLSAEERDLIQTPQVHSEPNRLKYVNNSSKRAWDQQSSSATARRTSTCVVNQECQLDEPQQNSSACAKISACTDNQEIQLHEPQRFVDATTGDSSTAQKQKRRSRNVKAQRGIPKNAGRLDRPTSYDSESSSRQKTPGSVVIAPAGFAAKNMLDPACILEDRSTRNNKETWENSLALRNPVLNGDPLDDIIQKLRYLSLNWDSLVATTQPQNAIVPYDGGGTMIPYESPKKKRPRPKVDLDPETNRVWNLLMGKEGGEGIDGADGEKQRWWEEERRVFRGRVDSFIARMHLVQGDRRFSKWKGSVVDSVVGVFLTQNVSDHLSSSAFMSLAAKFPLNTGGNNTVISAEKKNSIVEHLESYIVVHDETTKLQDQISEKLYDQGPIMFMGNNETANTNYSLGNNEGSCEGSYSKVKCQHTSDKVLEVERQSPYSGSDTPVILTGSTSEAEAEDRWYLEDVLSSQNSVVSSQNSSHNPLLRTDHFGLCSYSNLEMEDLTNGRLSGIDNLTSFRDLLLMEDKTKPTSYFGGIDWTSGARDQIINSFVDPSCRSWKSLNMPTSSINLQKTKPDNLGISNFPPILSADIKGTNSRILEKENANIIRHESIFYEHPTSFEIGTTSRINTMETLSGPMASNVNREMTSRKLATVPPVDIDADSMQQSIREDGDSCLRNQFCSDDKLPIDVAESSMAKLSSSEFSYFEDQFNANSEEIQNINYQAVARHQEEFPVQTYHHQQNSQKLQDEQRHPVEIPETFESNKKVHDHKTISAPTPKSKPRERRVKGENERKNYDWDTLRKAVYPEGHERKKRSHETMDSVNWEKVRCSDVNDISQTIRERGMNNMLAERIKEFLNRLVTDHGSIDLEWLRDVEPDKAKDYLLSIRGLGLKSVECVRLLTLHHLAFPVDTNVGRICVRLGWVPIQPLPESLQLHLLELYPVLETIQKYLWPRLCKLDQRTLYELHYQMITFGKVFCTKSKPNCNACPMRGECKHFASAFASARLALPGPEEKGLVSSTSSFAFNKNHKADSVPSLLHLEGSKESEERILLANCAPIIEEPATPEAEFIETEESAIEDAFFEDPDEIPMIKLNIEKFTQNLQDYMQANNMEIQDGDMSKALVAISPEDASIPMPKLKNINRLRTEHYVYELPDLHPLLEGFEKREADDPSSYLLAIWTPGETAQSIEPPQESCNSQEMGKLCSRMTCFTCNSIREAQAQTVRGTILIPCRTAMRGSFPLNGTYFQVNEMFADHTTSRNPIDVPRSYIWNLPRRTVYFGTSVPSIFKGLRTEEIQQCFWRGFVCVRGFDQETRAPKPLYARLHFPASKTTRGKKATTENSAKEELFISKMTNNS